MSGNEVRRISCEDITQVQNYIEQCIQRHMSLSEVKNTLFVKAKIEPGFTELVWKKLEGDNPDFFKVYHLRLLLKDQIVKFNGLLERQAELMRQQLAGPTTMNMSNGSHIPLMSQNSASYGQQYTNSALHHPLGSFPIYSNGESSSAHPLTVSQNSAPYGQRYTNSALHQPLGSFPIYSKGESSSVHPLSQNSASYCQQYTNSALHQPLGSFPVYSNGESSSVHPCMLGAVDISNDARRINSSSNLLMAQSPNLGFVQQPNGHMSLAVESHSEPANDNTLLGANDNTLLGANDNTLLGANDNTLLGANAAYESLEQIPRSFSLSDFTTDSSLDVLESYSGSPLLAAGSDNFLSPQYWVEQQDNERSNTIF